MRTQVELTGWIGAPGLWTFHWTGTGDDVPSQNSANIFTANLRSMINDLRLYLAVGVTAQVPQEHRVLDVDSGNLIDILTTDEVPAVVSSDTGAQVSRATMAKFHYITDGIRNNRLVRGGIFFGPLSDSALTAQGTLVPAFLDAIPQAHGGLLDILGSRLVIYSTPRNGEPGQRAYVQSASAWATPAVLRSRRD